METIWKYITDNASWIFSGIGLVLVTGIAGLIRLFVAKSREKQGGAISINSNRVNGNQIIAQSININVPAGTAASPKEKPELEISPRYILNRMKGLSLVDQQEFSESLVGHRIRWKGEVATVTKRDDRFRLQVVFENDYLRAFFDLDPMKFPNARLFGNHDSLTVIGEVSSFDGSVLILRDSEVDDWVKSANSLSD